MSLAKNHVDSDVYLFNLRMKSSMTQSIVQIINVLHQIMLMTISITSNQCLVLFVDTIAVEMSHFRRGPIIAPSSVVDCENTDPAHITNKRRHSRWLTS